MNLTLSVTQVNNYIKNIFDAEELLIGISVFGEISNFKMSGGYAYFDVKEEGATMSCVMFNTSTLGGSKNGDKVIVTGKFNYHVKLGKLSFVVSKLEPYGMGELYKKYLELKQRLESEGIFNEEYKKQLPRFACKVGVVTSQTGAVIHDIINVTKRKNPFTDIVLYPCKVQGEGADRDIANGIRTLDKRNDIDVIIVARGGGSFEDLSAYNTEIVARSVFECKKPIISAVGHETDFSLSDFASDMRAPTPSVGAELAVFDYYDFIQKIKNKIKTMFLTTKNIYEKRIFEVKSDISKMVSCLQDKSAKNEYKVKSLCRDIMENVDKKYNTNERMFEKLSLIIENLNPMKLICRGFSKITVNGSNVKSIDDIKENDEIRNVIYDGEIISIVKNKIRKV